MTLIKTQYSTVNFFVQSKSAKKDANQINRQIKASTVHESFQDEL